MRDRYDDRIKIITVDTKVIINACNKALPFVHFYYGSRVGLAN